MPMRVSSAREWQDWANLLIGIWLFASPITLGFLDDPAEVRSAVVVGFLVVAAEVFTLGPLRFVEEWINIGLGAWLLLSAWALDTAPVGRVNSLACGVLLIALAIYELWDSRRTSQNQA
jgi:hypothetical protein